MLLYEENKPYPRMKMLRNPSKATRIVSKLNSEILTQLHSPLRKCICKMKLT